VSAHDLCAFLVTSLVLLVLPGPAVVYVVSQTARLGLGRGLVSALGVECGTLVHAAAATVGLSALLARSEPAFAVVRWAGVAYLVILGWRQLRVVAARGGEQPVAAGESRWAAFRQGFAVEVLNPKTALFFLAFLPQFVDPMSAHHTVQLGVLGLVFVALAMVVDGAYAVVAAVVRRRARPRRHWGRAGGLVLWGLAALAAAS
jgi:threonine/homoserine/homoserine lactone efflux protein